MHCKFNNKKTTMLFVHFMRCNYIILQSVCLDSNVVCSYAHVYIALCFNPHVVGHYSGKSYLIISLELPFTSWQQFRGNLSKWSPEFKVIV